MTPEQFQRLRADGYNRIPLLREVRADFDNPLTTYLKLANAPFSFLFESVQGGEKWGRYSWVGLPARRILRVYGQQLEVSHDGVIEKRETVDDPLDWIQRWYSGFKVPELAGLPRMIGGLVGYFGYDTVRYIEPRLGPNPHPDPLGVPDILLMEVNELAVFDNFGNAVKLLVLVDPEATDALDAGLVRLDELEQQFRSPLPLPPPQGASRIVDESDFVSGFTEAGFKAAVREAVQEITDGELMQVVLSQRMEMPFQASAFDLYRALRVLNPSPYLFHLDLGDHQVVGSSPEILVRLDEGEVTVRPLAGTRARGQHQEEDLKLEAELLADPKERAEHLMLIDLGRNDVGRIAKIGSVEVSEAFTIERYSHVMHIVSNVTGQLAERQDAIDVLRATFPAGTLSGAPKVRALELIQELEPVKRGVYSGAVGYLSWNGNMDTAIAIRTAVVKDGRLSVQAGAGIVYDSDPDTEWEETRNKARAVMRAAAMAEAGLDRSAGESGQ